MHDLDRTQNEFESDSQEMEYEYDGALEFNNESYDSGGEFESGSDEVEEMEMAAELLEVNDEYELDQFLGKFLKKVKKAAGGVLNTGLGQQFGGLLKGAARAALPQLGNLIAPGIGGVAASKLGAAFGLELEGLSPQDQEFEAARSFVRFANEAAQIAANAPPNAPPQQIAKAAVVQAARKYAPGLLRPGNGGGQYQRQGARNGRQSPVYRDHRRPGQHHQSGRWIRQGRQIILLGV